MTIEDVLNSRGYGLHFNTVLSLTAPHAAYPGKTPARRAGILRRLEALDAQTRDTLDTLAASLRSSPSFDTLSPEELYMLRQRMLCALDFLSRLADSLPTPTWLSTSSCSLEAEDRWLLLGVWREFGPFWVQNLAWRISRGLPDPA